MSLSKNSKMLHFINYRMRITLDDRRTLVGRFMAFDKHMNVVLADCEEFRRAKKSDTEERRALGLVLLRGESVVSIAVEQAAGAKRGNKRDAATAGLAPRPEAPAFGRGAGGDPMAPAAGAVAGLAGPAAGLGAAPIGTMQAPQLAGTPRMYGAPPPAMGPGSMGPGGMGPMPPAQLRGPSYGRGAGMPAGAPPGGGGGPQLPSGLRRDGQEAGRRGQ